MRAWLALIAGVAGACSAPRPVPLASDDGVVGHTPEGPVVRLQLAGDAIATATPEAAPTSRWLWPPIVDSHVHLAYYDVAARLPATGIAAAVDLAAPLRTLDELRGQRARTGLDVLVAGPMLTHADGYPLDAWGADGYGLGCDDEACVTAAVEQVARAGARVLKVALDGDGLAPALVPVAVRAAHDRKLVVAVHALSDASAALAARAGADLLAHTPVEPLADATVAAWSGRAVISTLAAFGGGAAAIDNLKKLRAAGATILYGTDLGNTRDVGPSSDEVALLRRAGLDDAAIVAAMTTAPAAYWKLPFGTITAGRDASFLVLDRDPRGDVRALLEPELVYLHGRRVR